MAKTKFINAGKGLKQIFAAQFFAIFGGIAGSLVLTHAFDGSDLAKGIFAFGSVILLIAALVVELVGLHNAGKDNANFRLAFSIALAALFVQILISALNAMFPNNFGGDGVRLLLSIITAVLSIVGVYCVYRGIAECAVERGETGLAETAHVLWNIVMVTLVGIIVVCLLALVGADVAAAIIGSFVLVLGFVSDVAFLVLLGKSMNRMA